AQHDQVTIGESSVILYVDLERELDPEVASPVLKHQEQGAPRAAAKAVAADAVHRPLEMDGDIVPIGEFRHDPAIARLVVPLQIFQRRLREDDAESERVIGPVAFVDGDPCFGALLLQQNGKIEAGRPAADDRDLHASIPASKYFRLKTFF